MTRQITLLIALISTSFLAGCVSDTQSGTPTKPAQEKAAPANVSTKENAETKTGGTDTPSATTRPARNKAPSKAVMGWVENIRIGDIDHSLKAKLDSGAKTSSIDAEIIRLFERDGQEHVVFRVNFGKDEGGEQIFESPIKRWARIKRKGSDKKTIRRPVVEMTFCIGDQKITEEINLADRGNFIYPVLIGRNMLQDKILVDTAKTFTQSPSCK